MVLAGGITAAKPTQKASLSRSSRARRNPIETPPVCNYEGSDYQSSFWDKGNRAYEDRVEAIALRRLLPKSGRLLLELGAGAGRNTPRYRDFEQIVLVDYSRTQLQQAQLRLGRTQRYIYVAADIYHLPFAPGLFDAATMIRTLHHMADAPKALAQVRRALQPGAIFILEFASKLNLKAILRYLLGKQTWSPFSPEPVEFVKLNFDFHPKTVRAWLEQNLFLIQRQLTVSHYRMGLLKKIIPTSLLVALDALAQWTGNWWQLTPSVFVRAQAVGNEQHAATGAFFCCPVCGHTSLQKHESALVCQNCQRKWEIRDGIYDFRKPVGDEAE